MSKAQTNFDRFRFNEKYLSQIPALQLLINLGFEYLLPEQALVERQGKTSNVLLENILRKQLKEINSIRYKGREYLFSEENIQSAIQKLKNIRYDGLLRTNEAVYDLITLGTAMQQNIEGDSKSFNLQYIDWHDIKRNKFHVTAEFSVDRTRSTEKARPDIVLFVNGIPLAVIECKSPKEDLEQAVSQFIRNQTEEYIPKLFIYTQLLLSANKNNTKYATAGTSAKFWSIWKELRDKKDKIRDCVNTKLKQEQKNLLFSGEFARARKFFDALETEGARSITEQDETIYSLCRPERLLELVYRFILFDNGFKKIAYYQQYFTVKSTLERVRQINSSGRREGGIIWHSQGSGKSLTMVMLARSLALDFKIFNPRIILVTDRKDLDEQLKNTFAACGFEPEQANSGRGLLNLMREKTGIVTTLIHKFDKALNISKYQDDSADIFMLVDESHRTNFGAFAARMRQMFPNACYLGFTGTPLLKKEKNNFARFGGLIEPCYPIKQAVADRTVVPLLYEGRDVKMEQNKAAIDAWFDRHTQGLTKKQQADLKRKYARAEMLNKTDQVIYMRAFNISEQFRENWQNTGFKAQLVAPGKMEAIKYHEFLNDIGFVSSEVIISAPDVREGYEEVDDEPKDEVVKFWQKMMHRYGNEEKYNEQIIKQFKYGDRPEILIVVNKLLTGFDAPKNTVLYLCRSLREHTLLQAIARVNRIYENKEFGYIIDYAGILDELDKTLTMYDALAGFEEEDLVGTITSIKQEIAKLPQRYSDLWDLFKEVKNSYDEEAYEKLLADNALREEFYQRLAEYSKTLGIALSSESFIVKTDTAKLQLYKSDLKRFQNLKASVKLRYSDVIDYRDYEPKIKKLLNTHIQAHEVTQLNKPVNIFDDKAFCEIQDGQGIYEVKRTSAKADSIAYATKKVIIEKMNDDPAFYGRFSELIQKAIDDFRAKRLSDLEYLNRVINIRDAVVNRKYDDVPSKLNGNNDAVAFYGILNPLIQKEKPSADAALAINKIFNRHLKVQFWDDEDAQKRAINDIDDYLIDEVKHKQGIDISFEQINEIIEKIMRTAKHRSDK